MGDVHSFWATFFWSPWFQSFRIVPTFQSLEKETEDAVKPRNQNTLNLKKTDKVKKEGIKRKAMDEKSVNEALKLQQMFENDTCNDSLKKENNSKQELKESLLFSSNYYKNFDKDFHF